MLRVVLSLKAGRITASTILRKLGNYSRKNRLYQAFRAYIPHPFSQCCSFFGKPLNRG
jgi:TnpA family transposase